MALNFQIFPSRGLVLVRYSGHMRVEESFQMFSEYMRHPDCRPGQKQLVDLGGVTSYEQDYGKLFKLQAHKAGLFGTGGFETLMVYHAPTPMARKVARLALRSWETFDGVISIVQDNEADALAILGQPETSFDELMKSADRV